MRKIILFTLLLSVFTACSTEDSASNEDLLKEEAAKPAASQFKISDEVIGDLIKSIPSPLEISTLIKETNKSYDPELLNDAENAAMYTSSFNKALNLGIYSTDLGYISLYNHTADALNYISALRDLSDQLGIGQFYNFEQIRHLALNSNNVDSLLLITTKNFEDINNYLHQKKRSELSVLILTGGWLEALHLSCTIAQKSQNLALLDRVAEQKIILEQLYIMLDNYSEDPKIGALVKQLKQLKTVYDEINITYTVTNQVAKVVDGVLTFEDESESTIHYTPAQIVEIGKLVESIRASVI